MRFEDAIIKILEKLYRDSQKEGVSKKDLKKLKLGKNKLDPLLNYIVQKGWSPKIISSETKYLINSEGIDYLNNYKKQKKQEEFNRIIAFTGSVIALGGIYNFINNLGLINNSNSWIGYIFLLFMIISLGPIAKFIWDHYLD